MTVPHYGKREPGSLTASAPGDKLHFQFASYNDSGDSEALTGLSVTDIECFKNGDAIARATDSGYSLISDTGQIGDRVGLYRFSVQIFNTADDTGFYDIGSWYQVAVDSVTIDGKTVRLWAGSFEIGYQNVNVTSLSDTGVNNRLSVIGADADTGLRNTMADYDTGLRDYIDNTDTGLRAHIDDLDTGLHAVMALQDTGAIATAVWAGDTGLRDHIDNLDTGLHAVLAAQDTGAIATAVWAGDTGLRDFIDNADTGLRAILALQDTGAIATAVWAGDTGLRDHIDNTDTGLRAFMDDLDTGIHASIAAISAGTAPDTGQILNAIRDFPVESSMKFVELLRLTGAVLGGTVSGAGTSSEIFKNAVDDSKARVTATMSGGNRTAITYNLDT